MQFRHQMDNFGLRPKLNETQIIKIIIREMNTKLIKSGLTFLILAYFTSCKTSAQEANTSNNIEIGEFQKAAIALVNDTSLAVGDVGILVQEAATAKTLCQNNPKKSLIPASNQKLIITATALKILGADYRYTTHFQTDGTINDSTLNGNFYIKGGGDPSLGSPEMDSVLRFRNLLDSIVVLMRKAGINKINGKIVADASVFAEESAPPTWQYDDLGNYYGAPPSGLNVNDNQYQLIFAQRPLSGSKADIAGVVPLVPEFTLESKVTCFGKSDEANNFSVPFAKSGFVNGTIPAGDTVFSIYGAVPDPAYLMAWHLDKICLERGIAVSEGATTVARLASENKNNGKFEGKRTTLFTWESPTLENIVRYTNFESVNLYAEVLLRTIALHETGSSTLIKGAAFNEKYWRERGMDTHGMFYFDGSGLSPRDGVTPEQLCFLLRNVAQDSNWYRAFYNSLPQAGKNGTLKTFLHKTITLQNRVRAKSGTISRVKSYSGYLTTEAGKLLVFSVIANNFTCSQSDIKKKIENFLIGIGKN